MTSYRRQFTLSLAHRHSLAVKKQNLLPLGKIVCQLIFLTRWAERFAYRQNSCGLPPCQRPLDRPCTFHRCMAPLKRARLSRCCASRRGISPAYMHHLWCCISPLRQCRTVCRIAAGIGDPDILGLPPAACSGMKQCHFL